MLDNIFDNTDGRVTSMRVECTDSGNRKLFIPIDLRAYFPTRTTHGASVVGTSSYPSTPNTTVNVMRP